MSRAGPDGPLGLRNGGGAGIREGAGPDFPVPDFGAGCDFWCHAFWCQLRAWH
jgi:hypothetical protein